MKYAWIDEHRDQYSVTRMCRQLEVSRTRYGQWRTRPPSDRALANAVLDAQVAAMHAGSQRSYGRPRIVRGLRAQGVPVSHERVRKSLQRQGLRPVLPGVEVGVLSATLSCDDRCGPSQTHRSQRAGSTR